MNSKETSRQTSWIHRLCLMTSCSNRFRPSALFTFQSLLQSLSTVLTFYTTSRLPHLSRGARWPRGVPCRARLTHRGLGRMLSGSPSPLPSCGRPQLPSGKRLPFWWIVIFFIISIFCNTIAIACFSSRHTTRSLIFDVIFARETRLVQQNLLHM